MSEDSFSNACDQLSRKVDARIYERLRWARTEAPMLAKLVELAQGAFGDRDEFELSEEGSGHEFRRFVVKVHGNRIFAVVFEVSGTTVTVGGEAIERSSYRLKGLDEVSSTFEEIGPEWMAEALARQFSRIVAKADCAPQPSAAEAKAKETI